MDRLQLRGPFPFSLTGVLASFLQPLAEAKIPIFSRSQPLTPIVLLIKTRATAAGD